MTSCQKGWNNRKFICLALTDVMTEERISLKQYRIKFYWCGLFALDLSHELCNDRISNDLLMKWSSQSSNLIAFVGMRFRRQFFQSLYMSQTICDQGIRCIEYACHITKVQNKQYYLSQYTSLFYLLLHCIVLE